MSEETKTEPKVEADEAKSEPLKSEPTSAPLPESDGSLIPSASF